MKQKYVTVLILLTTNATCLSLPTNWNLDSDLKQNGSEIKEESNKTQLKQKLNKNFTLSSSSFSIQFTNITNLESRNGSDLKSKQEFLQNKDDLNKRNLNDDDQQTEVWNNFENEFVPLENRLPDLTDDEYKEINEEGATPLHFLKGLSVEKNENNSPVPIQCSTPIFITVPIVINGRTSMPLSLAINGQNISLNIPSKTNQYNNLTSFLNSTTTPRPTNKMMDYNETSVRQTNRHRSNFSKQMYAF